MSEKDPPAPLQNARQAVRKAMTDPGSTALSATIAKRIDSVGFGTDEDQGWVLIVDLLRPGQDALAPTQRKSIEEDLESHIRTFLSEDLENRLRLRWRGETRAEDATENSEGV